MHELSIAQAIVEEAERVARAHAASRILRVAVRVGRLSGVDAEALAFAFPLAAEGSLAADAQLAIDQVPAQAVCGACGRAFEPEALFLVCPHCGASDATLRGGRDLLITAVELAAPEENAP